LKGADVVIVNHSTLIGKPLAAMLMNRDATVTVCHKHTRDLAIQTRQADVLVTATGVPGLITRAHVKPGAVVIDVGIAREGGKIKGDVAFEEVLAVAQAVTPVPGGVGPMTVAMLLRNTVKAARYRRGALDYP
jgi:methylenetetrahydrofolate dehydrogenase (NADP+)/methenyltetrahydrofolate cyclohydrolase